MSKYIAETAQIGVGTEIGINCVIAENVKIGKKCILGHNVIIHPNSVIGDNVRIDDNTVIGKKPLSSPRSIFKVKDNYSPTKIGNQCQIGTNVIIYVQCKIGNNNLIADLATIREDTIIGDLNIIGRNVTIENFCKLGNRNKLETNSYITAYSRLEDYCFVAPCVATSNDNFMGRDPERFKYFKGIIIKRGGRIGVNSTILPGKTIGEDAVAAAGAVVTHDLPMKQIWAGNPAKNFKEVPKAQLVESNLDKKNESTSNNSNL
ncbi:MAG: acyltransferase [Candidatus Cloacimonadota bacterium]|nr:acyltransferase [Candidatus Cloacimonadota bacterium]